MANNEVHIGHVPPEIKFSEVRPKLSFEGTTKTITVLKPAQQKVQDKGCTRLNIYLSHHFSSTFLHSVSEKSDFVYLFILHFCTPPITNSMVCWLQNSFFGLVVPSKLSWGHTLKVFVPRNGLIVLNAGPKQLCSFTHSLTHSRFTIYFREISPIVSKFAMNFWTKYSVPKYPKDT